MFESEIGINILLFCDLQENDQYKYTLHKRVERNIEKKIMIPHNLQARNNHYKLSQILVIHLLNFIILTYSLISTVIFESLYIASNYLFRLSKGNT